MQKEMYEEVSDGETPPNDLDTSEVPLNPDASQSIQLVLSSADQGTMDALAAELNITKEHVKKLELKLAASQTRVLQLENHNATGRPLKFYKNVESQTWLNS